MNKKDNKNVKKSGSKNKKETVRKSSENKTSKKTSKKVVHEEKKAKSSIKEFFSSIMFLKIVFVFLIVLVIILAFMVYHKKHNQKEEIQANMVVPIRDFNANYSFGIDLKSLVGKKYLFKVTNYRNGEVNSEDVYYRLTVSNDTSSVVSVTKDENKKVIDAKTMTESDPIKLVKDEEITDYYYVEVEEANDVQDGEKIQISIVSEKTSDEAEE